MSGLWAGLSAAVAAFGMSLLMTHRLCRPGSVLSMLDHPNERSLHDRPVPRSGGLAILSAIAVCSAVLAVFYSFEGLLGAAVGLLVLAIISFLDDKYFVPAACRFVAHVVVSLIVLYSGLYIQRLDIPGMPAEWPFLASAAFTVLFIVWMINLYNFMDGMDGFAGGMALFGFGSFAAMGWMAGQTTFFLFSLVVAAASLGFLIFNFPPARIFMGDIGSSSLGLLAAMFTLWGTREGIFPFWTAILVFSPFIVDATVTLARRLLRREKIWQAHKTHFYQRLVLAGWGHRRTVLIEYGIMLGCAMTAIWSFRAIPSGQVVALIGWSLFYLLFFLWVSRQALPEK